MEALFKEKARTIYMYVGKEISQDPYENNAEPVLLNPIPVKALVGDFLTSQAQWKMPGIVTSSAKEIYLQLKYKNILFMTQKIVIDGTDYQGWKEEGKLQYRQEGDFIRFYVYSHR